MPFFKAADAELFYEDTGRGPPVLLLHGLGGSSADWAAQVEALAPRYRVLVLDARGSGRSRDLQHPAGPFSVKQFADDVARLLDHLAAAPAHVVGLSMGGMIAFQLAVDHPQCVRSLTIVNSVPALVPRTLKERLAIGLRLSVARLFGPTGMARIMVPRLFPRPEQAELRRRFRENLARNEKWAYVASQRALIGWSVQDRIGAIEAPALVVASEQDYWPVAAKEAYARQMKRAEVVVVAGARHALPLEAPEQFNHVLTAFLDRQAAGPRQDTPN
jgi:pimeloyl-ACP methyl ester carboxylesterase